MFEQKILGVDLGARSIRLLEAKQCNKPVKLKCVSIATPEGSIADGEIRDVKALSSAIKRALAESKIKTKKTAVSINTPYASVREMKLPLLKREEIMPAVEFELEQTFPGITGTHSISYKPYAFTKDSIEGIVSFCPIKVLEPYIELSNSLGLNLQYIDISSNCSAKAYNCYAREGWKEETVLLVDIGYASSRVNIIMDGRLLLSRNISSGSREVDRLFANHMGITEKEAENERLSGYKGKTLAKDEFAVFIRLGYAAIEDQIRQTMDFYSYSKYKQQISKIILLGGGSCFPGMSEYYSSLFRLPVEEIKPLKEDIFSQKEFQEYILAIGAVVREE